MEESKPDLNLLSTEELAQALAARMRTGLIMYMQPTNRDPICKSLVVGAIAELDQRLIAAMRMVTDAHPKPKQKPKKKGKS